MIIIVMGVSGSGKSTIGEGLATRLGQPFIDGDSLHPAANREKMAHGIPLDDTDRQPWLEAIVATMDEHRERGEALVLACSALKRRYRDFLRGGHDDVRFVYLHASHALLVERLGHRSGHFFDPSLLDSQLATLEEPSAEEAFRVEVGSTPAETIERIVRALVCAVEE
ncbi:gluconate kinase [Luteibacter rhizovicinus DSM 16549]|uniref:Gluconokinase n=2 Tax=Luteibacter rhizovicinus TaxID=242606 RepID=A0A0G9HAD0_9GAMM|nr:gluconate kinase [Luteibacter rhizovicinus DSM 16549]KLD66593.1 gluconate kinase [Luteibacter rhizovicinus DSM 16549]KLD76108.1 gluconate kinase [Xanthomonas hyacinthi DSM 19077]